MADDSPYYCEHCGSALGQDARFCDACGHAVEPAEEQAGPPRPAPFTRPPAAPAITRQPSKQPVRTRTILVGLAAFAVLSVAVGVGALLLGERFFNKPIFETRPTFVDDFSNPNSGWTVESGADSSSQYDNGRLLLTLATPNQLLTSRLAGRPLPNLALEVETRLIEGPTGSSYGIVARQRDADHLYLFEVSGQGAYRISRNEGEWKVLRDWTRSTAIQTRNATNQLRLYCASVALILYVNGVKVYEGVDTAGWTEGETGLALRTAAEPARVQVSFDNFKVWETR